MKINKVTGCMSFSLNVDGKEEVDMTDEERFLIIDKISEWLKNNPDQFHFALSELCECFGDYQVLDSTPCESCGDIVDGFFWEI